MNKCLAWTRALQWEYRAPRNLLAWSGHPTALSRPREGNQVGETQPGGSGGSVGSVCSGPYCT